MAEMEGVGLGVHFENQKARLSWVGTIFGKLQKAET